jgi:hypothetical protein
VHTWSRFAGDSLLTVSVLRNRTLLGVAGPLPLPQAEDPSGWLEARFDGWGVFAATREGGRPFENNIIMPKTVWMRGCIWIGWAPLIGFLSPNFLKHFATGTEPRRHMLNLATIPTSSQASSDWRSKKPPTYPWRLQEHCYCMQSQLH